MTQNQWNVFVDFCNRYKQKISEWDSQIHLELLPLQQKAAQHFLVPPYQIETPLVYNSTFDGVNQNDEIKLIVVGDNPGKDEQLAKNRRYLVGQSGKIAEGFFKKNPELGIDFRKNVLIFNKTPIHTAKTKHLSYILKNGSAHIRRIFAESQQWCALETIQLHNAFKNDCSLWLVGYGELGQKGLFAEYARVFEQNKHNALLFQHFSMNRFSIDLKTFCAQNQNKTLLQNLTDLGLLHRKQILGY